MRHIALIAALWPVAVGAEDWTALDGAGVRAALEGRVLVYESGAIQDFRPSGKTLYHSGRDSWGNWRVQGDQYCSQWPPSDTWACYDLEKSGDRLRFVGISDDISVGTYAE